MMAGDDDPVSPLGRDLLAELAASGDRPPGALGAALDAGPDAVYETIADLSERGLVVREGFDTCHLTERGRRLFADRGEGGGGRDDARN
jgi:DNA-binding MarR family transcriptional regulator